MNSYSDIQMATIVCGAIEGDPYHYYPSIDDWNAMPERLKQCLIALFGNAAYVLGAPFLGVIATGYLLTACL